MNLSHKLGIVPILLSVLLISFSPANAQSENQSLPHPLQERRIFLRPTIGIAQYLATERQISTLSPAFSSELGFYRERWEFSMRVALAINSSENFLWNSSDHRASMSQFALTTGYRLQMKNGNDVIPFAGLSYTLVIASRLDPNSTWLHEGTSAFGPVIGANVELVRWDLVTLFAGARMNFSMSDSGSIILLSASSLDIGICLGCHGWMTAFSQ